MLDFRFYIKVLFPATFVEEAVLYSSYDFGNFVEY
jgi:hypothetical protein